jgi:TolB-like protein/Tfp pilus assembly protein PilF
MLVPSRVEDLAFIYVLVGEYDAALDAIEHLLSIPSRFSVPLLRLDPRWDPLRDHARYKALLRRHGFEPASKPQEKAVATDYRIRLAVLPFEDLSPEPQEWFSDGMTGELIATLGKIEALGVISRTSAMSYKRSDKSLPQIARELNVSKLVEGSVLSVGGRYRITVDLIDAATDTHLWSNSYEHDERDVITLQNEVARAIAREIEVAVTPAEESRLAHARQVNPEVYKLFLKGQSHTNKWTGEGFKTAIELFEQAIALDPTYARAWAGLAEVYQMQGLWGMKPPQEVYPLATAAARKALELDDTLGLAHATLGQGKFLLDWDWTGPEEDFQRALELNPGEAHVHYIYSFYLTLTGRSDEGVAEIKRALELDPFQWNYNAHMGWCLFYARRYDESIAQYQTLLEKDPDDRMARVFIPLNYAAKGMYDEALAECEKMGGCRGDLAWIYAVAGERQAALDEVSRLETKKHSSPWGIAVIYAGLNEKEQAFEYLEKAYDQKHKFVLWIKVAPELDPLRDDPRFDDLLRRVGLEPTGAATFRSRGSPHGDASGKAPEDTGKIMLAVLPFDNLSPDPQEWFSDGMTGEVIATLGKIEALGVISRTSAMRYKDADKSLPEIARELNVSKLVEGSVLRTADRVRITVELIDAATDTHLWSNSYERDERDVITLQNEVARAIAREIEIAVTPAEESLLTTAQRVNPEAYRLYLKGQDHADKWTPEGFKRAIEFFEQAIALDPTYARAWAGLAEVHLTQGLYGTVSQQEAFPRALAAASKALEFDDTLGLAHATLGCVRFFVDWDWYGPEEDFQRALKLSPGNARVHYLYSFYLILLGRFDEGITKTRRAIELDPFRHFYHENLGWSYWMARRHDEAIAQYRKLMEKKPDERFYYVALATNYAANGMHDEALAECAKLGGCRGDLAWIYAVAGERQAALNEVSRLEAKKHSNPWAIAVIYAGLGEKEQAFEWLEKVYEDRDPMALWFNIAIKLDPLRDDPRFDDLLRRIGLEPPSIPAEQTP